MRALAWAVEETRLRGSVLVVIHVDAFRQEALEALAPDVLSSERSVLEAAVEAARTMAPGIEVQGRICDPPVAEALIEAAVGADMLVIGAPKATGSRCVHHARCPVVIVRGN